MLKRVLGPVLATIVLSAASCGESAGRTGIPTDKPVSAESLHYRVDGFELSVSRDSLLEGGSLQQVLLAKHETPQGIELRVEVEGASNLKALYFELAYDPAKYSPESAAATDALQRGAIATASP